MKKWIALFVLFMPCMSQFSYSSQYDNHFCVVNAGSQGAIGLVDSDGNLISAGLNCISQLPVVNNSKVDNSYRDYYQDNYYIADNYGRRRHRRDRDSNYMRMGDSKSSSSQTNNSSNSRPSDDERRSNRSRSRHSSNGMRMGK